MLALAALQSWVNWPVLPKEISIGPAQCPPLGNGALQADNAVLRDSGWEALFLYVFVSSVAIALLTTVAAYAGTNRIGMPFVRHWWRLLAGSAVLATLAAVVVLWGPSIETVGCEAGAAMARVPAEWIVKRALLAGAHGAVFYVLLSWLLCILVGRTMRRGRWYDNHRVPFPYLLRRQG